MGIINWILELLFGGKKKEEVKKLDKAIKVKETETKELEKKVINKAYNQIKFFE